MGNVHEVVQSEPVRSGHGAVLRLRPGAALVDSELPSYVATGSSSRRVGTSCLATGHTFLVISTGGKWGYGHELEEFLSANAPVLEDAVFYVSDEYAMYVREWRIRDGALTVEFVAPDNSHVGLVLVEQAKHREFALDLLDDMLDGMLWSSSDEEEPSSLRFRAVMALVQYRPDSWHTWYQLGTMKAGYAPAAAYEAFERAIASAPPAKRSLVEVATVRVLGALDIPRALAFGRSRSDVWIAEALAEHRSYWNPIAAGVHYLAELEQTHGAPELCARLYWAWLRSIDNEDVLATRFYNIACLRAKTDVAAARDWLRVAMLIEPRFRDVAPGDPDLAALGELSPLLDPDRDA